MKKWICIVAVVCLLAYMCGRNSKDNNETKYEQSSKRYVDNSAPSWIQGKWTTVTPYGNMTVEIRGNNILEFDGEEYRKGTYSISGNEIITDYTYGGLHIYYLMDFNREKIYIKSGSNYYYYHKTN